MRAAVFYGIGDLRIEECPDPTPGPGQVLIEVAACGICGTDHHIFHGEFNTHPPVIIGHEYSGTVLEIGEGVSTLKVGDLVAIDPNIYCGLCRPCRRGLIHCCENLTALGVDIDGGFAEKCVAPEDKCFLLPDGVPLIAGGMVEPLACCIHGIDRADIQTGDRVAVIGAGAIGLIHAQLARLSGAELVMVSDPLPERRKMARDMGFDCVIDPLCTDPLRVGGELEGGADVVIEAVGSKVTTAQAIEWAAPGGKVLWFGVTPPGDTVAVEPNLIFEKELTILGARINPYTHSRALALLAQGKVEVETLITQCIGLDELSGVLENGPQGEVKIVVEPWR